MFLELREIHKSFLNGEKEVKILRGLNLEVEKGERIAIVGPSGSGKTTLLNIIGALDEPTSGKVIYEGEALDYRDEKRLSFLRRKKIGFVFQFYHLMPELNVYENLVMPGLMEGLREEELASRAQTLLERLRLTSKVRSRIYTLSGGERQKVAIGRALFLKPELVLADEPTGNLDPESAGEVMKLFLELNEELQSTLILVTHNLELAQRMDKTYLLKEGLLVKY